MAAFSLLMCLACSGGGGEEEGSIEKSTLRFKGGEDISAKVRLLESVSGNNHDKLQAGEIVLESSFNAVEGHHEMSLNILLDYQIEVSVGGVDLFKTLVFSKELIEGSGELDLGFINAGSTAFSEASLSQDNTWSYWNECVSPYGQLDPYTGRRDLRLSNLFSVDNEVLNTESREELGLFILGSRLLVRLQEAVDDGDRFWNFRNKTFSQVWSELESVIELSMSSGVANFETFMNGSFSPYYSKYRLLSDHLVTIEGVEQIVVSNFFGASFGVSTSDVPELVNLNFSEVGVLQRWTIWDEFESLLNTMTAGDLLSESSFTKGIEMFRTFDDRSTGVKANGDAFDTNFGYERYLEDVTISLININGTGDSPEFIRENLALNPVD